MNRSSQTHKEWGFRHPSQGFAWCLLGSVLLAPLSARAQTPSASTSAPAHDTAPGEDSKLRALKLNDQGAQHFEAGRYRQAIESFVQAHATQPDSNLLFNIAACYELLGEPQAAIEKYERFVQAPDGDPAGKPAAQAAMARLRQQLESAPSSPEVRPLPDPPSPDEVLPNTPSESGETVRVTDESLAPAWLTWTALGTGGALLAAGATAYALGAQDHQRVSNARGYNRPETVSALTRQQATEWVDSGNTKKALGVGALVAGVAALSGYAGWYFWEAPPATATLLIGGPQSASFVSVSGAF